MFCSFIFVTLWMSHCDCHFHCYSVRTVRVSFHIGIISNFYFCPVFRQENFSELNCENIKVSTWRWHLFEACRMQSQIFRMAYRLSFPCPVLFWLQVGTRWRLIFSQFNSEKFSCLMKLWFYNYLTLIIIGYHMVCDVFVCCVFLLLSAVARVIIKLSVSDSQSVSPPQTSEFRVVMPPVSQLMHVRRVQKILFLPVSI